MSRLISVVVPSYNYAQYLPQAIASVAFQTYEDIELVVVDDASRDDSPEVIRGLSEWYATRFSRVHTIFHTHNMGAHASINEGVRASRGELVAILNADDLYERERFACMTEAMGDAQWAFSAVRCIDAQGEPARTQQATDFEAVQRHIAGKRFMVLAAIGENVAISTGNLLFARGLFDALDGFRNYKYVHDYDFFVRACLLAEPVYVPDTAYLYRLHGENSFTRLAKEGVRENRMVWLELYRMVRAGQVSNTAMLREPEYQKQVYDAVCAAGTKKKALWAMCTNPVVRYTLAGMRKKYRVDE